ncbi:uncharacterized protein LOC143367222 [Andrena cerasifolii]|uniref:uncharacterized protein LOC143367222 n=1 Tax=Andrena cerasifolii TaxID=2819439 RepID=UPI00403787C6
MNSVRLKSPFIKFDSGNIKYNETLRSEARFLQKLSEINEFHAENLKVSANEMRQKSSKGSSKLSPEDTVRITVSSNENLPPGKSPRNEAREIQLTVKSTSVSCLRGNNISASTAVLKVHSKTNLKKKALRSRKHPGANINSERDGLSTLTGNSLNGNDNVLEESGESDVNLEALIPIKRRKRISSSDKKKRNQSSSNTSRSAEDGAIGDSLFCCPFELVEIYSVQKDRPLDFGRQLSNINRERDSIRTFPKEGGESSESATLEECICPFPGIRSSKIKEEILAMDADTKCMQQSDYKASAATFLNNETSVEPTRDRRDPNSVKVEVDLTKTNQTTQLYDLSDVGNTFEPGTEQYEAHKKLNFTLTSEKSWEPNLRKKQEKTDEKIYLSRSEEPKGSLRCHAKEVHPSSTIRNNSPLSGFGESYTQSDEALSSTCKKPVNDVASVKMFVENEDLIGAEKRDEKVQSQDADLSNENSNLLNRDSLGSSESGFSKSLDSKRSGISSSESDSPSLEDTVINLQEKKPKSGSKSSENESLRKKKIQVIIAKQRNEMNNANLEAITDSEIGSSDEDTRLSKVDDTEESQHRVPEKKTTRIEIKNPKSGITKCETERTMFNYEDIKICQVLMKIHAHLSCDWQKMECIRMKLRGADPIASIGSVITLQLLDKTIARCKSYIHGSNDSFKAESEITKLLSKYVVQLVKAVNKNKLAVEEQVRHISRAQPKFSQEQDLNKRVSFNIQ